MREFRELLAPINKGASAIIDSLVQKSYDASQPRGADGKWTSGDHAEAAQAHLAATNAHMAIVIHSKDTKEQYDNKLDNKAASAAHLAAFSAHQAASSGKVTDKKTQAAVDASKKAADATKKAGGIPTKQMADNLKEQNKKPTTPQLLGGGLTLNGSGHVVNEHGHDLGTYESWYGKKT